MYTASPGDGREGWDASGAPRPPHFPARLPRPRPRHRRTVAALRFRRQHRVPRAPLSLQRVRRGRVSGRRDDGERERAARGRGGDVDAAARRPRAGRLGGGGECKTLGRGGGGADPALEDAGLVVGRGHGGREKECGGRRRRAATAALHHPTTPTASLLRARCCSARRAAGTRRARDSRGARVPLPNARARGHPLPTTRHPPHASCAPLGSSTLSRAAKSATMLLSPSRSATVGSHPSSALILEMSGLRLDGSSAVFSW